jgi:hypothetical protein
MANPNPSPETRFKPGETLNPLGKTSEQRKAEVKAAEIAANLRLAILSRMQERVDQGEDVTDMLTSDALRLFKDSEDRAHGTPKQSVEHAGPRGGPIQTIDPSKVSTETLREIMGAMRDEAPEPDEG